MHHLFDLTGKIALITGSARGLGFAYAEGLANAGAHVILNDLNDTVLQEAVEQLQSKGLSAQGIVFNVADEKAVEQAFQQIDEQDIAIDILINNAGIQYRQSIVDLALADWQKVIDVNLTSVFLVSKAVASRMIARNTGGKIINIASLTSEAARPTVSPYTAAKGGVKMLTRSMAAEWAKFNIQANAIGPGYILTDMNTALINNADFDKWVKNSNPAERWGKPEELVGTAIFLSSTASDYINGQVIYVDGGWLAVL
ncbi:SDR family oxidoreductase [Escherichia fergusonii]|uniref:SDR family oxidoreductase n=1 Tax=Escherichia fergusonii TaxID=564 RepID=UPI000614896A|nr:SDR family oxidoreductase [Escherichia fergusonii]EHG6158852.1 SDR family oxidoreductase [Escherichia fergusonii]EHG6167850.1 SDR family oxidoreductase [Escherichia fergusonii]EHJ4139281.1 SDR family oxidoreductase [Escherichia fergusonii]EHK3064811.1 SDR family oxidoreductase [Escherichia fergusonii]EHK3071845.1 SDR family oxidoreductase [Escherichia fergusonii]